LKDKRRELRVRSGRKGRSKRGCAGYQSQRRSLRFAGGKKRREIAREVRQEKSSSASLELRAATKEKKRNLLGKGRECLEKENGR